MAKVRMKAPSSVVVAGQINVDKWIQLLDQIKGVDIISETAELRSWLNSINSSGEVKEYKSSLDANQIKKLMDRGIEFSELDLKANKDKLLRLNQATRNVIDKFEKEEAMVQRVTDEGIRLIDSPKFRGSSREKVSATSKILTELKRLATFQSGLTAIPAITHRSLSEAVSALR